MNARQAIGRMGTTSEAADLASACADVHAAKVALGERGPVWWEDGAPDLNRHMARNTIHSDWLDEQTDHSISDAQ